MSRIFSLAALCCALGFFMATQAIGQTPGPIQGFSHICPGATTSYFVAPVPGAVSYVWQSPPGSLINGEPSPLTLPAPDGEGVSVTFGQTGGQLCVSIIDVNGMQSSSTCQSIVNQPIPPTTLPPVVVCAEDAPYCLSFPPFDCVTATGNYQSTLTSWLGCDSVVKQSVTIRMPILTALAPIHLMPGDCFTINGNDYCEAGTFTEVLTSWQGCDSTVNFSIVIDGCNLTANAGATGAITCATPVVTLQASSNATHPVTYSWSTPFGFTSNLQNPQVTLPGSYTVTVTDITDGCTATATAVVTQNTAVPIADAGPDITLTCDMPSGPLAGPGTSAGPNFTYNWVGPYIINGHNIVVATVGDSGTYVLTVTNTTNGCTAIDAAHVSLAAGFPKANAGPDRTLTCAKPTATLGKPCTTCSNLAYQWTSVNGNIVSGITSGQAVVNEPGLYVLVVTKLTTGCTKTDIVMVSQNTTLPTANAGSDTLITCAKPNGIRLSAAASTTASGGGFSRNWEGPDIDATNRALMKPMVSRPGLYTLTITDNQNGCTDSDEVIVEADPDRPLSNGGPDQHWSAANPSVTLDGSGSSSGPDFQYTWSGPGIDYTNRHLVSPTVDQPGTYYLKVKNLTTNCLARDRVLVIDDDAQLHPVEIELREEKETVEQSASIISAGGELRLQVAQEIKTIRQLRLFDGLGRLVLERQNIWPADLDLSESAVPGLYFWSITLEKTDGVVEQASGKVVLAR